MEICEVSGLYLGDSQEKQNFDGRSNLWHGRFSTSRPNKNRVNPSNRELAVVKLKQKEKICLYEMELFKQLNNFVFGFCGWNSFSEHSWKIFRIFLST